MGDIWNVPQPGQEPVVRPKSGLEAIKKGNIKVSDKLAQYLEIHPIIPDAPFEFLDVRVHFWGKFSKVIKGEEFGNDGGIGIDWTSKVSGTGRIDLYEKHDGTLEIDTQAMGKEFALKALKVILDQAKEIG